MLDFRENPAKLSSMVEQGYNNDIVFNGASYHIQTEDWGPSNPFVVTRVFSSGCVIVSVKTPYEKMLAHSTTDLRQALRSGMRVQHEKILDQLVSGDLFRSSIK